MSAQVEKCSECGGYTLGSPTCDRPCFRGSRKQMRETAMKKTEQKMNEGVSHRCQDGHHDKKSYPRGATIPAWTCAGFSGTKPCACPCHQGKQIAKAD